jgi:hypothetical protein
MKANACGCPDKIRFRPAMFDYVARLFLCLKSSYGRLNIAKDKPDTLAWHLEETQDIDSLSWSEAS